MALWKSTTKKVEKKTTKSVTKNKAEKKVEAQESEPLDKVLTAEGFKRRLLVKKT